MNKRLIFLLVLIFLPSYYLFAQYYGVEKLLEERWSVGVNLGVSTLNADVESRGPGLQLGIYGQKTVSRVLDFRLQLFAGRIWGLDTEPTTGYANNWVWNGDANSDIDYTQDSVGATPVYMNYQMTYFEAAALFKFNINRLFSPVGTENWDLYLLGGGGVFLYRTQVDAYNDAGGSIYDFSQISSSGADNIRNELKSILDGDYESSAQQDIVNKSGIGKYALNTPLQVGLGFKVLLADHYDIGVEARYLFINDDLLDGQRWNYDNTESINTDRPMSLSLILGYTF